MVKDNKEKITITLDKKVVDDFKEICNQSGNKISSLINILINQFVADVKSGQIKLFGLNKKEDEK